MAYKVLGQTLTTAAAANVVVNLIKDPSFEGITRSMTGASTSTDTIWQQISGTQWYYQNNDSTYFSNDLIGDISTSTFSTNSINLSTASSRYGSKVIGYGCTSSPTGYSSQNWLAYGMSTSRNGNDFVTASFGGANRAIPVTGSTVYYFGCDIMALNYGTSMFRVLWFTSAGTYISRNEEDPTSGATGTSWTRQNYTATSPANAAYAAISINISYWRNNTLQAALDGIYFGTTISSATTFPDPSTGGVNSTLNAPFTSRYSAVHSGAVNNSTTVTNFAGDTSNLYVVPAGKEAVISTIAVNNPTVSSTSFRIAVVPSGETLALKHWIAFDIALAANSTTALTLGLTLATGDKIVVSNDIGSISFSAFGSEN